MHKLLARQLRRAFGDTVPGALDEFLKAVDDAYQSADGDRAAQEHTLELMSQELNERNAQLRRDIEAQRTTAELLRQREAEFLDLIQHVPQMIMVRRGGRFLFMNRSGLDTLGYASVDQLAKIPALDVVHPDDREVVAARIMQVSESGTWSGTAEVRFRRNDGDLVIVEIALVRTILFEGEPAVLVAGQDVTDRKKMQQRLLLADRMVSVGTLAAGVAHEINNPLAYVLANLDFVAHRVDRLSGPMTEDETRELREALNESLQGARRVREIVQGMKIFSRADQDSTSELDLRSVLDSAISIANNEIRHRARIVRAYEPVPAIFGNEGRLVQVFVNLLVNGAQAIPDGAADLNEICVGLTSAGDRVKVTVRDSGSGMPPEVLRRIFDPFFTTKPIGVGSGLGLAICHGIITGHGGEIQVESELGKGTTFAVLLPIGVGQERTIASGAPAPAPKKKRRVLVVDDEPLVGKCLRRTLGEHDVEVVTDGNEALKRLATGAGYEVIICDLMMPAMTGMDLHSRIAVRWPDLADKMVFLTGGAFSAAARAFLERVPNRKLEKPFDSDELRALVNEPQLSA